MVPSRKGHIKRKPGEHFGGTPACPLLPLAMPQDMMYLLSCKPRKNRLFLHVLTLKNPDFARPKDAAVPSAGNDVRKGAIQSFLPVRRIWIRRAAISPSSSLRTKYNSVVRMSLCPANLRACCIWALLQMASLMPVSRSEWMPIPGCLSRLGSIPVAPESFFIQPPRADLAR
jgi:hypothetical protein